MPSLLIRIHWAPVIVIIATFPNYSLRALRRVGYSTLTFVAWKAEVQRLLLNVF